MTTFKNKFLKYNIHLYLGIYFIFNLLTLTKFPFVHSDEAWLAGLSNEYILQKSIFVSESFFDLMPRTIHTIKSFYHLLQLPFIGLFGNTVFTVRLISLIASTITLYFFYKLLRSIKVHHYRALLYTIIFSLNLQFVYAAHFGRQEMLLLMMLSMSIYLYYKKRAIFKTAILLAISIGFHPNALIITLMVSAILLKDYLYKKILLKDLLIFFAIIGGSVLLHVGMSLLANPTFFTDYWTYGQTLGVDALPSSRMVNFKAFYLKLYYQISGTYYIPPMKSLYITGGLLSLTILILSLIKKFTSNNELVKLLMDASLMVIGYNAGIFIIGRFNTTSISFLILPIYILLLLSMEFLYRFRLKVHASLKHPKVTFIYYIFLIIVCLLSLRTLSSEVTSTQGHNYQQYLSEIQDNIKKDAIILGNLNSGFIFHDHTFYDIRNLAYINRNSKHPDDVNIETYINNRHIDTIIYYEEYDYIHRNQQWEILYGDDQVWYDDLQVFLKEKATLVHEFEDMYYGSRIIRFLGDYPWKIYIYQVD